MNHRQSSLNVNLVLLTSSVADPGFPRVGAANPRREGANLLLPTAREGNVFTGVCLSTVGLMATGSLCCIIGQQTNVDWNALVPLVSNGNKHRCTYVHLKIFILVDVVTLLYM